jgi:hypothetical protein
MRVMCPTQLIPLDAPACSLKENLPCLSCHATAGKIEGFSAVEIGGLFHWSRCHMIVSGWLLRLAH